MIICRADLTNLSLEIVILLMLLLRVYFLATIEFMKNNRQGPQATNSIYLALTSLQLLFVIIWPNAITETLKKQLDLCI